MRHASAVSVEMMNAMLGEVAAGRTDADLAIAGFAAGTRLGATPWDFGMASGPQSEHMWWGRLPAFDPFRRYERGDIVHPDVYGCLDGYFYDFVRSTVVGGEPGAAQRDLLEGSLRLAQHVSGLLRPGVRCCEVHADASSWAEEQGIVGRDSVLPFYGHGVGLGFEGPWLTAEHEQVLAPGMVVAVEICLTAGGEGAAHEDVVLVTDGEPETLTAACKPRWWA
jgi:Xaa-Pro aminopeptidase